VRRILANLLCEEDLARAFLFPRRSRTSPPRSVLERVSKMATLLRVFAREGDRLWLPTAIDTESIPEAPGLPRPALESGPLHQLPRADEVLAWCETPEVVAHREGARDSTALSLDALLYELLWKLPVAEPAVVAAVNHRTFQRWVAEEIGCELPGAQPVWSMEHLDRVLRAGPRSWVVKAPLSAAGRDRYIERSGPALSEPKGRRTVERLFARHGTLFFEPWMDRTADFGVSALLTDSALRIAGIHRQRVDRSGRFLAIDLDASLSEEVRDRLSETTETVAECLHLAGYVGPFGIDAWTYRKDDGSIALNPLGEINARMTFGLVAWALAERAPGERLL